jgi:hypothetical protein
LELPSGIELESLPEKAQADQGAVCYELSSNKDGNALHSVRTLRFSGYFFPKDQFRKLSLFYDHVLKGDGRQTTLRVAESASPH